MARQLAELTEAELTFVAEYHLATLTTFRADNTPHVVPVGFTVDVDANVVRVICDMHSQKALNATRSPRVAVCSVDGARWLTFEGNCVVTQAGEAVAEAVRRYTLRYRVPRPNPERAVLEITVDRVLGKA